VDVIGELVLMMVPQNIDQYIAFLGRDRPKANGKFAIGFCFLLAKPSLLAIATRSGLTHK
jgi:hypothetical protein